MNLQCNNGLAASSGWLRVNRHCPCLICGKPDWCLISQDGTAVICARIESDKPAGNKGAGWIHKLTEDRQLLQKPTATASNDYPLASIPRRDLIYNALLWELTLSDSHREHLHKRGLSDTDIEDLGYKTLPPDGRATAIRSLVNAGFHMAGVPGFYFENNDVRLLGEPGILIPIRDVQGMINGLQVRADKTDGGKYRWISSASKPFGCSSGAPIHVSHPEYANGEFWITEGALKADIAAIKIQRCILAIAGVGNWPGVIPIVRTLAPARVIVAFDMDKLTNHAVQLHHDALLTYLINHEIRTFEADWDSSFNGLDDLIIGGQ